MSRRLVSLLVAVIAGVARGDALVAGCRVASEWLASSSKAPADGRSNPNLYMTS